MDVAGEKKGEFQSANQQGDKIMSGEAPPGLSEHLERFVYEEVVFEPEHLSQFGALQHADIARQLPAIGR